MAQKKPKKPSSSSSSSRSIKDKIKKNIKKTGKSVVKAAKIANAVRKVGATVTNPIKMSKVAINAARGKGVVYPGSAYIGPGNEMKSGGKRAKSSADKAAFQHDLDYDKYLKEGKVKAKDLYMGFSDADKRLMKKSDLTTEHGVATYGGMLIKKGLAKVGISKRIRDKDVYKKDNSVISKPTPKPKDRQKEVTNALSIT